MINKLKDIEREYNVEKIVCNKIKIWPYLRLFIADKLLNNKKKIKEIKKQVTFIEKIKILKLSFYGIINIFKKTDSILFATSKERKLLDGKYISKNIYLFYKYLKKPLLIEHPYDLIHYKRGDIVEKRIISLSFFMVLAKIVSKVISKSLIISGESIFDNICKRYAITIDLYKVSIDYLSFYYVYKIFFFVKKPKQIIISVYYGYGPVTKAARDLGIKVIEIQHGIIHEHHEAYCIFKNIDENFYPNIFLGFGEKDKKMLIEKNINYNLENIAVVGNYYLDILSNKEALFNIKKYNNFKYIVSFSSSLDDESYELSFLSKAASLDEKILYLFIPRRKIKEKYLKFQSKNLIIVEDLNCNEIINISGMHLTNNSTCALEAVFCGLKNIYIDLEDDTRFINKELNEFNNLFFRVRTEQELVEMINVEYSTKVNKIDLENFKNFYYKKDTEKNIIDFLIKNDIVENGEKIVK